jgi:hypothetical protein
MAFFSATICGMADQIKNIEKPYQKPQDVSPSSQTDSDKT